VAQKNPKEREYAVAVIREYDYGGGEWELEARWEHEYDAQGRQIGYKGYFEETLGGPLVEKSGGEYVYDAAGNLVESNYWNDDGYDPLTWSYDSQGRVVSIQGPWSRADYEYDSQGRLLMVSHFSDDGETVELNRRTSYEYDGQGRVVRTETEMDEGGATLEIGSRIEFEYGAGGGLRRVHEEDFDQGEVSFSSEMSYTLDGSGRPVEEAGERCHRSTDTGPLVCAEIQTTYERTGDGRLVSVSSTRDGTPTWKETYDYLPMEQGCLYEWDFRPDPPGLIGFEIYGEPLNT
jgi:YD repeat-containing protein